MNEVAVFNYKKQEVRTVNKNGEMWFVGKDEEQLWDIQTPNAQ